MRQSIQGPTVDCFRGDERSNTVQAKSLPWCPTRPAARASIASPTSPPRPSARASPVARPDDPHDPAIIRSRSHRGRDRPHPVTRPRRPSHPLADQVPFVSPKGFTKDLVARFIRWHIQEQAFGGSIRKPPRSSTASRGMVSHRIGPQGRHRAGARISGRAPYRHCRAGRLRLARGSRTLQIFDICATATGGTNYTARFRGFHFKADPYRRPQRGPVTDVNLPRGLRGRRVS